MFGILKTYMTAGLKQDEQYIVNESQEISLGETPFWTEQLLKAFPAFKHKNYQLYFIGQLISLIGTWLQMIAQQWLVLELTNSAFWVGAVSAVGSLPILIFSLFGGVIVDRFPKKKILIFTQVSEMLLAFILGLLAILQIVNLSEIVILAFLLGLVSALDMPARQAFAIEMVGREDLPSAIALNSGIFNGARVVGPALAGLTIGIVGTGGAFLLNGLSFIAVIIALFFITTNISIPKIHPHPLQAIKDGLTFSFSHPIIGTLLIFTAINSVFGWSYTTIMPVIAKNVFHQDATGFGYLIAISGIGALLGAILVSTFSRKIKASIFILGGNALFAVSVLLFSLTSHIFSASPFLFLAGLGLISNFSMVSTAIQQLVGDHIRGRVMSIYTLMFLGLSPLGSLQIGFVSEHLGPLFAIRLNAVIVLTFGLILAIRSKKIREL